MGLYGIPVRYLRLSDCQTFLRPWLTDMTHQSRLWCLLSDDGHFLFTESSAPHIVTPHRWK